MVSGYSRHNSVNYDFVRRFSLGRTRGALADAAELPFHAAMEIRGRTRPATCAQRAGKSIRTPSVLRGDAGLTGDVMKYYPPFRVLVLCGCNSDTLSNGSLERRVVGTRGCFSFGGLEAFVTCTRFFDFFVVVSEVLVFEILIIPCN